MGGCASGSSATTDGDLDIKKGDLVGNKRGQGNPAKGRKPMLQSTTSQTATAQSTIAQSSTAVDITVPPKEIISEPKKAAEQEIEITQDVAQFSGPSTATSQSNTSDDLETRERKEYAKQYIDQMLVELQ